MAGGAAASGLARAAAQPYVRRIVNARTTHWHTAPDGRVVCDVCPRACALHEGQRGLCFVRACEDGEIVLTTWGRSSGFCVDPIEKKPLNHFLPRPAPRRRRWPAGPAA